MIFPLETIKNAWYTVSMLYLTESNDDRFIFGEPFRTGWTNVDGLYEKYKFSMYSYGEGDVVIDQILNMATELRFYFPSDNLQTNGYELEPIEIERLETSGNFVELENNSFSLTAEELRHLKEELSKLMAQKRMPPKEYIKRMKNEMIK